MFVSVVLGCELWWRSCSRKEKWLGVDVSKWFERVFEKTNVT